MNIDLSKIPPQTLQMLGQQFGVSSPEEVMQLIQSNPQIAQQLLGDSVTPDQSDAAWIEQAADRQVPTPRSDPRKPQRTPWEDYYNMEPGSDLPVQSVPRRQRPQRDVRDMMGARAEDYVGPDNPNAPASFNDRFVGQSVDRNYDALQQLLQQMPNVGYGEGDARKPVYIGPPEDELEGMN